VWKKPDSIDQISIRDLRQDFLPGKRLLIGGRQASSADDHSADPVKGGGKGGGGPKKGGKAAASTPSSIASAGISTCKGLVIEYLGPRPKAAAADTTALVGSSLKVRVWLFRWEGDEESEDQGGKKKAIFTPPFSPISIEVSSNPASSSSVARITIADVLRAIKGVDPDLPDDVKQVAFFRLSEASEYWMDMPPVQSRSVHKKKDNSAPKKTKSREERPVELLDGDVICYKTLPPLSNGSNASSAANTSNAANTSKETKANAPRHPKPFRPEDAFRKDKERLRVGQGKATEGSAAHLEGGGGRGVGTDGGEGERGVVADKRGQGQEAILSLGGDLDFDSDCDYSDDEDD